MIFCHLSCTHLPTSCLNSWGSTSLLVSPSSSRPTPSPTIILQLSLHICLVPYVQNSLGPAPVEKLSASHICMKCLHMPSCQESPSEPNLIQINPIHSFAKYSCEHHFANTFPIYTQISSLACKPHIISTHVGFQVFTAVTMKNSVFWDIKSQFVPRRRHVTSPLQSSGD
jgi:hypothetical protein